MKKVYKKLLNCYSVIKSLDNVDEIKKRLTVRREVLEFILEGRWHSNSVNKGRKIAQTFEMSEKEASEFLGIKTSSVRSKWSRALKSIDSILGYNFVDTIISGNTKQLDKLHWICKAEVDSVDNICLVGIVKELKLINEGHKIREGSLFFEVKELKEELEFLKIYSKKEFFKKLIKLDAEKIEYILEVLDGKHEKNRTNQRLFCWYLNK